MKDLGYRTHNSMLNLGSLFIFTILYLIKVAFLPLLALVVTISGRGRKYYQTLKQQLFFKEIIILLVEGCMEFLISGYLNILEPIHGSEFLGESLSLYIGWYSMVKIMIILPCMLLYVMS